MPMHRILAIVLATLFFTAAHAAPAKYGKELIAVQDLSPEIVAQMNGGGKPLGQPKPGESPVVNALMADAKGEWTGDEFRAPQKGNPYVIVIHAKVTSATDGEMNSLWETGWVIGDGARLSLAPGFTKAG